MPIKIEDVELGKTYQLPNGMIRRVFEIIPANQGSAHESLISDRDIIRYETDRWTYEAGRYGGKTRVKTTIREKTVRRMFAQAASKKLD